MTHERTANYAPSFRSSGKHEEPLLNIKEEVSIAKRLAELEEERKSLEEHRNTLQAEQTRQHILETALFASQSEKVVQELEDVKRELLSYALKGYEIPNYQLTQRRTMRRWVDEEEELVAKLLERGLTTIDIYEDKVKSVANLDKIAQAKGISISDLYTQPEGTYYLKYKPEE